MFWCPPRGSILMMPDSPFPKELLTIGQEQVRSRRLAMWMMQTTIHLLCFGYRAEKPLCSNVVETQLVPQLNNAESIWKQPGREPNRNIFSNAFKLLRTACKRYALTWSDTALSCELIFVRYIFLHHSCVIYTCIMALAWTGFLYLFVWKAFKSSRVDCQRLLVLLASTCMPVAFCPTSQGCALCKCRLVLFILVKNYVG